MNDKSYLEQLVILMNNFDAELTSKMQSKKVFELSIAEIDKFIEDFEALKNLNDELIDKAREDENVQTDTLSKLLVLSEGLNTHVDRNIASLNKVKDAKNYLIDNRKDEIERINAEKETIQADINKITTDITLFKLRIENATDPSIKEAYQQMLDRLTPELDKLNETIKSYDDRIAVLNSEIETLINGGMIPLDESILQYYNITEEEIQATANSFAVEAPLNSVIATVGGEPVIGTIAGLEAAEPVVTTVPKEEPAVQTQATPVEELAAVSEGASSETGDTDEEVKTEEDMSTALDGLVKDETISSPGAESEKEPEPEAEEPAITTEPENIDEYVKFLDPDALAKENEEAAKEAEPEPEAETKGVVRVTKESEDERKTPDLTDWGSPVVEASSASVSSAEATAPEVEATSPEAPAAPEAAEPEEEATAKPTTIENLIASGRLPKNIKPEEMIAICNSLSIPATDLTFKLNREQMARLRNERAIQIAFVNQSIVAKQEAKIHEYDTLIAKYKGMLADKVTADKFTPEYIGRIEFLIGKLEGERDLYLNRANELKENPTKERINVAKRAGEGNKFFDEKRAETLDNYSTELKAKYAELEAQRKEQSLAASERMKKRKEKDIQKLLKKISDLHAKQCTASIKQTAIINENNDKYIQSITERIARSGIVQGVVEKNVNEMIELHNEVEEKKAAIDALEHDRMFLDQSKLRDRIENAGMTRDVGKLRRRIATLDSKMGKCDRRLQYVQDYGSQLVM